MRNNRRHLVEREARGSKRRYKEWENMRCFRNLIVVPGFCP